MNRGGSFGGGQSSLGYLFGSDEKEAPPQSPSKLAAVVNIPPYGVDVVEVEDDDHTPAAAGLLKKKNDHQKKPSPSNSYPRAQGQNSGITDRPSTKVKSVPGGDSSLGYLFGDK